MNKFTAKFILSGAKLIFSLYDRNKTRMSTFTSLIQLRFQVLAIAKRQEDKKDIRVEKKETKFSLFANMIFCIDKFEDSTKNAL